jgi:ankyrin repeat protein
MLLLPCAAFALTDDEQVEFATAVEEGNTAVVKKLLDGGVNINEPVFAWTWLQIAANKNQLDVVKLLVERGADLNYKHPLTKMTALSLAAVDGHTEIVKYLLSKGADPNVKLRGNVSVVRVVRDDGNTAMANLLLQNGAKDDGCKEEKCF